MSQISHNRGFTMTELLVVIVVLGILSSLSLASFIELRQKAYDAAARSKARDIGQACEVLMAEFDANPLEAAAMYNLNVYNLAGYTALSGVSACGGGEACAARFPELSASRNIATGVSISARNPILLMSPNSVTIGGGSGGFGIDCIGAAYHRKGTKTYYWIPRQGIYASLRP